MPSLDQWKQIVPKGVYEQIERKYQESLGNRNTSSTPHMERIVVNEPVEAQEASRSYRRARISFTTVRKVKPRDHRAISEKYALDSLVSCGILQDDSTKFIPEEPKVEVLTGMPEMTRIEIEEI